MSDKLKTVEVVKRDKLELERTIAALILKFMLDTDTTVKAITIAESGLNDYSFEVSLEVTL